MQTEKLLSNSKYMDKKQLIIAGIALVLVALIVWIGFCLSSPRRVVNKFEKALQNSDYTAAEELMAPLGILAEPGTDELNPSDFKNLFNELAGQSVSVKRVHEGSWRQGHHMDPDMYYPTAKHWAGYYQVFLTVENNGTSTPLMLKMRTTGPDNFSRLNKMWRGWEIISAEIRIAGFGE